MREKQHEPTDLTGWWYTYPSEKSWSSSVGMIIPFPTEWKVIQNSMVPNHHFIETTTYTLDRNVQACGRPYARLVAHWGEVYQVMPTL
jgi:hypothetical protein